MSVRQIVKSIQLEVLHASDLSPDRAAALLMHLTALIGNCNDEIRESEMVYAHVLMENLGVKGPANRAKIRAETSAEYGRKREARDTKELVIELSRSLKYFLKSKTEELQLARYQQ